jgi:hypothetical protein
LSEESLPIDTEYSANYPISHAGFLSQHQVVLAGDTYLELFNVEMEVSAFSTNLPARILDFDIWHSDILLSCSNKQLYCYSHRQEENIKLRKTGHRV